MRRQWARFTPSHPPDILAATMGMARWRVLLRVLAATFFVGAGVNHFAKPEFYRSIVPPGFPDPPLLVAVSGACEIAGGVGLLVRPLRRSAGWGLIALLLAVLLAAVVSLAATAVARADDELDKVRAAAAAGDRQAMYDLGYALEHGAGVAKDPAEAAKWYQKAAAAGDASAMNNLGWLFQN